MTTDKQAEWWVGFACKQCGAPFAVERSQDASNVWHTFGERLACDLHKLWGDRVLRARNPDGKDHGFKLKHQQNSVGAHRR